MNQTFGNDTSEMLNLYIDGELDSTNELSLFSELAKNEELRTEMRELLAIRESVNKDVEAFTPPLSATKAVYTALGFSLPTNVLAPTIATVAGTTLSVILKKIWAPALAAVVATIVTTFVVTSIYDNNEPNNSNIPQIVSKESVTSNGVDDSNVNQNITNGTTNANDIKSTGYENNRNRVSQKNTNSISTDRTNIQNETQLAQTQQLIADNNETTDIKNTQDELVAVSLIENSNIIANQNHSNNKLNSATQKNPIASPAILSPIIPEINSGEKMFCLQLRGLSAFSFPENNVPSKTSPFFSNMSLGLLFQKVYGLNIGVEFGQEQFAQQFYNTQNNRKELIKQNPMTFWGALAIKGEFDAKLEFLGNAQPFTQLSLGYCEQGPLSKIITGLQWHSSDYGYGMNIGIEGALLLYNHQNVLYSTEKIGISYGLFYSF